MVPSVLAHGSGELTGDGVPGAVLYAAAVIGPVIAVLGLRARGPVPVGGPAVATLSPDDAEAGAWPGDAMGTWARSTGQVLGVAWLFLLLAIGWLGSDLVGLNPLTVLIGSISWWALPTLTLLLGDWWRVIDPFDAIAAAVGRQRWDRAGPGGVGSEEDEDQGADDEVEAGDEVDEDEGEATDWWLPAVLLGSLTWTLTCWTDGLSPRSLAVWLSVLTLVMVGGALASGRAWVRRNSPLAVLCGTIAAGSPLDWSAGRIRFRSPLRGLAGRAGGRRSLGVLIVVLGTAAWDVTAGTKVWSEFTAGDSETADVLWATLGLTWSVLLVGGVWIGVAKLIEALARGAGARSLDEPLDADLAPALAPLAAVVALVHQLSALIYDGQQAWSLASDPFARGWDLFGTASYATDETLLAAGPSAWIRLTVLALGLGLMAVAMWDRLASRLGESVLTVGWVVAGWTALSGCLALWFLLSA